MNLQERNGLLTRLRNYMLSAHGEWQQAKEKASHENGWFIPQFIELAVKNIAGNYLQRDALEKWAAGYAIGSIRDNPKTVGIVMAGNIPLVGFHDLLCVFISGHKAVIKPSSKDAVLIQHVADKLSEWNEEVKDLIQFGEQLKNCDAYIATGSNNSAGYFEYYFKKYPHIIRRNRTSVGVLTGAETTSALAGLADDVYVYFGLGCRNVTKILVPQNYDFVPLLAAFSKYNFLADHHKYKNNYDYNLAIHLLNGTRYMSNPSLLLIENASIFSPVSQLNYEFYNDWDTLIASLKENTGIQCIAGRGFVAFGDTQRPGVADYADGIDTLHFLSNL